MKKFFFLLTILTAAFVSNAQSTDEIDKLMIFKKYAESKTMIDKIIADPKNAIKSVNHYYKGRVYNSFSKEPKTSALDAFALKQTAYESFQKAQELDKKDERMKAENYESYFDLFGEFYNMGANIFNATDKNFPLAYKAFSKAEEIEQYIFAKGYKFAGININKLDTNLIINIGKAAVLSQDTAAGIASYKRITDANVAGADQEGIYLYLASYYNDKKDDANFNEIIAKGKKLYPKNTDWEGYELDKVLKEKNKAVLLAKLDEVYKRDTTKFGVSFNYAVEMFNMLHASNTTDADKKLVNPDKLSVVTKAAIASDKGIEANSLLAKHLYNQAVALANEAITVKVSKPAKPLEAKKKKDLTTAANLKYDELFPYADKSVKHYQALQKMTTREKSSYRELLGILRTYYEAKLDSKKAAEYDKLRDAIKF